MIPRAEDGPRLRQRNLRLGLTLLGVLIGLYAVAIAGVIVLN